MSSKWKFEGVEIKPPTDLTVRAVLTTLMQNLGVNNKNNKNMSNSVVVNLGHGDPSNFPSFQPPTVAEEAIVRSVRSAKYNAYAPTNGLASARRAVAEYLSRDGELCADDVYLTIGCSQGIEVMLQVAATSRSNANILLPKPGYPYYESRASSSGLEVRHFRLLEDQSWEVDLQSVEALCDENTVAMVIINPGNPTGCVYSRSHLEKVALTAKKLGILVISDEVYERLAFGNNPFVPMGDFSSITPVVTLGSISKRWCVPGWRIGWLVAHDPNGILNKSGLTKKIFSCLNISCHPATFIQSALPDILEQTKDDHFSKILNVLRETADACYKGVKEIPCFVCPYKPQGSMSLMVKLNVWSLSDIKDDLEFCLKLAKEESVIVLPGVAVGTKNWVRITFAVEPSVLEDGLSRIQSFCQRHSKNYN